jgi:shikimate kinase
MDVKPDTVFLIGFMGSGKTTLGKKLAAKLGLQFVDLDEAIVSREKSEIRNQTLEISVVTLVEEYGITYFRERESETLKSLDVAGKLISTGGGTPCFFDNLSWMKAHGAVVYIELDEKTLFNRLQQTNLNERPLLKGLDEDGLKDLIHQTLAERMPFYRQADIFFNPLKQSLEELALQLSTRP